MAKQVTTPKGRPSHTEAQRIGIYDRSGSLVVSASAGTGKTTVLTERCVDLVAGKDPIDMDRLLVVTFTEAAALEMRERIRKTLGRLYEERPTSRLARQMMLLDGASISTLHSFCLQVVRENFSTAGVEPDAGVLDDDEAQMLKDDVLGGLFEGLYEGQDERARQFARFVADYGQGRDDGIRGQIRHMHEYLRSLPPPKREGWKQRALGQYALAAGDTLSQGQFEQLRGAIVDEIDLLLEMGRVCLEAFEAKVGAHQGLSNGKAAQEFAEGMREEIGKVTTGPGLRAWIGRAAVVPWGRIGRWGDVSDVCKGWASWLKDNWKKRIVERWVTSAEAWSYGIKITAEHAGLLLWLVEQFDDLYTQEKRRIGKIDYSDMEEHAFALLAGAEGRPSDIARAYQQRYDVVLVDEFQDTNPIQAAIVHLVSRESAEPPQANLFVVGDVKQSIYGFRMTDPKVFRERQERISAGAIAGKCISLQENFRSRPDVLEFVNGVFRKLMQAGDGDVGYDAAAELKVGRTDFPEAGEPVVELHVLEGGTTGDRGQGTGDSRQEATTTGDRGQRTGDSQQLQGATGHGPATAQDHGGAKGTGYRVKGNGHDQGSGEASADEEGGDDREEMRDREREAWLIAGRIKGLLGKAYLDREGKVGKLSYRDMVILLRSTQHSAETYADVLRQQDVPVYAELRSGYFASREVKDMLSLLAVLENMQQDIPLAAVLRSPLFGEGLCDADLVEIRLARQDLEFHQAVRWYAESGTDAGLRGRLLRQIEMLDRWRGEARVRPLAEVISGIYQETGLVEYVTLLQDGEQRRANLMSLYERARQFGQFSRQGLRRFVTFITEMIRSGREASTPTAVSEAQDVVRIMSIHASKGLEFPVVFLGDLGRKFNDMDFTSAIVMDREGTLGIEAREPGRMVRSDTLIKLLAAGRVRKQSRAEALRVLYVAMTRAKERLILVGTPRGDAAEWLEENRQLWGERAGALPGYVVRYGGCLLDWIGATTADAETRRHGDTATDRRNGNCGLGAVSISLHTRAEMDTWRIEGAKGQADHKQVLAALDGKTGEAPGDAALAIERLSKVYLYEKLTRIAAITPVTELKGRLDWGDDDDEGPRHARLAEHAKAGNGRFGVPRRLRPVGGGDAARQRGTATHLFLEKVDLAGEMSGESLGRQLKGLVERKLLSQVEAEQIDLGSVEWFLRETELGRALRANHGTVHREMPFIMRLEPELLAAGSGSDDLADCGIVRGVIDVLWTTPDGIEIADFKTDAVEGAELRRRIALYKDQLRMYALAIQRIWKRPVCRLWLAFLHARHVEPFGPG